MASTIRPESFRSRPLPATPSSTIPAPSAGTQSRFRRNAEDSSGRSSLFTIASIRTTLPHYSVIDSSGQDFIEQVEHWNETANASTGDSPSPTTATFPDIQPPEYSSISRTGPETALSAQQAQRPKLVLHKFHISYEGNKIGFGKPSSKERWATLKLLTRAPLPGSKKRTPRFIGGDTLQGCVDLRLEVPSNVHSIKLVITGKAQIEDSATYPAVNDHMFLNQSYDIYSKKTSGDPRENGRCDISKNKELNGTLHGSYSFPFSIPFPTFVEWRNPIQGINSREASIARPTFSYDLPPSFREKNTTSAVVYEFAFVLIHGALRSRSRSMTEITFMPKMVSPPASEKRQTAYCEGALLPGPAADPDGWRALPAVIVRGQYQGRPVEATCIIYLAEPLSYTRGTIIPCHISFSCLDFAFLEALTSTRAINLRLLRNIYHSNQSPGKGKGREKDIMNIAMREARRVHVAKAVWWKPPKTDTPPNLRERYMEGEVHLPKTIVSSCKFPLFEIEYTMELLPFMLTFFTPTRRLSINRAVEAQGPEDDRYESLVKQVVEITGFHEHGPVPVAFTTQALEDDEEGGSKGSDDFVSLSVWASGTGTFL